MNTYDNYISKLSFWGRLTMLLGYLATFVPVLYLWIVRGVVPTAADFIVMIPMVVTGVIVGSFIEPITAFPIIGATGSYIGWFTGSVLTLKVPCALAAQSAAEVEPGTPEGSIISNISMPVATVVALIFTLIGALLGGVIVMLLPASVLAAFTSIGPAIFGALLGNYIFKYPVVGIGLIIYCVILNALGAPFWLNMPSACIIGVVANLVLYKKHYAQETN